MPVRNVDPFLTEAIASLTSQSLQDFEVVVVDDASNDNTPAILSDWVKNDDRVRVLHNPVRLGLALSLNRGAAATRGDLIARMDGDDICEPERLGRQVDIFEDSRIVLCGTAASIIAADGALVAEFSPPVHDSEIRRYLLTANPFVHPSVIYRKAAFQQAGGYPAAKTFEDYHLWVKLLSLGKGVNLPDALVLHRIQPNSYTAGLGDFLHEAGVLSARFHAAKEIGPWIHAIRPIARSVLGVIAARTLGSKFDRIIQWKADRKQT